MMFILQRKNSYFLFLLFFLLTSCYVFIPTEPVAKINSKFKTDYGHQVNKAKKEHYKALKESDYDGTVSFKKTAYGRLKQKEIDFRKENTANNPFIAIDTEGDKNIRYLTYNSGPYIKKEKNIFDNIRIPDDDFKYYDLGKKDFNEINNIELQEAYDYISIINEERMKEIKMAKLRELELKKETKKDYNLINKTKEGLKELRNKIKSVL